MKVPEQLKDHTFKKGNPGGRGKAMSFPVRLSQARVTLEQEGKLLAKQGELGFKNTTDVIRWLIDSYLRV